MEVKVFSFFSGLGLLDLGFEAATFNIAFVNEFNERILNAYCYARRNANHIPEYGYSHLDICSYLNDQVWDETFPDYNDRRGKMIGFIGGPPCPDFSVAGNNEGCTGINGRLTNAYINLIIKRQPDFFLLENVKGLYQTKKHREFYDLIKNQLGLAGYSLFDSIENALEYGVPQYRDRLILVGFRRRFFGGNIQFGIGRHRQYNLEEILALNWPEEDPFIVDGVRECPEGIINELTVEYWFQRNDVLHHANAADRFQVKNVERYKTIPEGDTKGKSFKRLHRWRYSPTAAYGNNEVHLHPYQLRRLSVAESMAIQSLPQEFEIPQELPLSLKFKMVGNGVPFLLSEGIASDIHDWIGDYLHSIGEEYD